VLAREKVPFASSSALSRQALAQACYGRAYAGYRAARAYLHAELEAARLRCTSNESFGPRDKASLFAAPVYTVEQCVRAIREIATAAGSTAVRRSEAFEKLQRDVETLRHHAFVSEARYATVAQPHWHVPVDFPFITMD
jgi:hypothetical protein